MHYNKIIEGVIRFIDRKYVPMMNDLQIAGYYIAAEAVRGNPEGIINTLTKNPLVKMLVMPGKDGEIAERKKKALSDLGIEPDFEFTKLY